MEIPKALYRPGKLREADETAIYRANPSIIDYLPWVEYLEDGQCLLLDDGISVGAVYRIEPVVTEGRPMERLIEIRDQLEDAIQDSLEEDDISPWVVQFFCQDEDDSVSYLNTLRNYVKPWAQGTAFTEAFLAESERHLNSIAQPIFHDSLITGQPWRGQQRQTRMAVYRWLPAHKSQANNSILSSVVALNQVCERLVSSLAAAGIVAVRQNGGQIHSWLLRHFNPSPDWGMAKADFYHTVSYETPTQLDLPIHNDFAESLWFTPPVSDPENGLWWFDGLPHKAIPVERLRRPPEPGTLTGEVKRGDNINALMDMMPEGTVVSLTIVAQAQDKTHATADGTEQVTFTVMVMDSRGWGLSDQMVEWSGDFSEMMSAETRTDHWGNVTATVVSHHQGKGVVSARIGDQQQISPVIEFVSPLRIEDTAAVDRQGGNANQKSFGLRGPSVLWRGAKFRLITAGNTGRVSWQSDSPAVTVSGDTVTVQQNPDGIRLTGTDETGQQVELALTVHTWFERSGLTKDFYSNAKQLCKSLGSRITSKYVLEQLYEEWGNFYLYDGWAREFYVTSTDYLAANSGSAEHQAKWAFWAETDRWMRNGWPMTGFACSR